MADRPALVLLFVAALTAASVPAVVDWRTGALRLEIDASIAALSAEADPATVFHDRVRAELGADDPVVVVLRSEDLFSPAGLARVARLTRRLADLPGVSRVESLATARRALARAGDLEIGRFFRTPPADPGAARAVREAVLASPMHRGWLVSEDGRATALFVHLDDASGREYLESGLDGRVRAVALEEAGPAEVFVSGAPDVMAATSAAVLDNLSSILPLSFALAAAVLFLAFRTAAGTLVPLATIALALLWTLAAMALVGEPLNLITSIVPPLVVTLGFSCSMRVVSEFHEELRHAPSGGAGPTDAIRRTLDAVLLPVGLTALTTALGFGSLLASPFPAIREFGAFSALGVVATLVASLTFTPAALHFLSRSGAVRSADGWADRVTGWAAAFDLRHRRGIFAAGGVVMVLSLVGASQIRVAQEHIEDFAPGSRVRTDYAEVDRSVGGATPLLVAIELPGERELAQWSSLQAIRELQLWLEAQPEIGGTTSVVDFLMVLNRVLHGDDPAWFEVPQSRALARQLLLIGAGDELDRLVDASRRLAIIRVRSHVSDSVSTGDLIERIRERLRALPEPLTGQVSGEVVVLDASLDEVARGQLVSLGLAVLTIYGVLAVMFTSARIGLLALFPNLLPIAIFFGVLGASGTGLSTSTSLIACLALGIAVDDTIHYFARFNRDAKGLADEESAVASALRSVVRPVTFTTLGLCLGFLALTRSDLSSQAQFGALAAFTLAAAWLIDLTLTPALCSRLRIVTLWDVLTLDLGAEPQRSIPLLRGLSLRQARIVALMLSIVNVPAGRRLMAEGEQGAEMFVVLEGELRGSVTREGREIELARMRRGDSVGEIGLFAGRRTADVDAVGEVRLLQMNAPELERLRRRYPRIASRVFHNLNEILAERLVRTTRKVR